MQQVFNSLKQHLRMEDNQQSPQSLKFSWDNLRTDGVRVLARLDWIYIFSNTPGQGVWTLKSYAIRGDNTWNDHHAVVVELGTAMARKSRWKMNSSLLDTTRLVIEHTWRSCRPTSSFPAKLKITMHAYRAFCKKSAVEFWAEEDDAKMLHK